jgi:hypothetical protein
MSLQVSLGGGKGGTMGYWMRRGSGWQKRGVLVSTGIPVQVLKTVQGHTPGSPQFGLRLAIPEGHLALIQQKTALLFWESRDSKPVWFLGAISQRKIAANSGRWEAKLW